MIGQHIKPAPETDRIGTTTAHTDKFEITAQLDDGLKVIIPVYRNNVCTICTKEDELRNFAQLVEFLQKTNIGLCCAITLCSGRGGCTRMVRKRQQKCPVCQKKMNVINLS